MKKIAIILIFCITSISYVYSQGFDWQYSSRLPFNYPYIFAGLTGGAGYSLHNTALDLSEGNGDCCKFTNGSGLNYAIGLTGEYWIRGHWTVNLNLSYYSNKGLFTAPGENLPFTVFDTQGNIIGHDTASFENEMNISLNYLNIQAGTKYRLFNTYFFVGAAIEAGLLINQKVTQTESVVSPSYFRYNDGSQKRELGIHQISDISNFIIVPKLTLGYDISLGLGIYTTPFFTVGFPLQNIAKNGNWTSWDFRFGISILRAITYK